MSDIDIPRLTSWLVARGLAGALETDLMQGFCTECRREGLQLSRAMAFVDTLHPVHEGRAVRWRNDGHEESPFVEYGRTNEGEAAARWRPRSRAIAGPADHRAAPAEAVCESFAGCELQKD